MLDARSAIPSCSFRSACLPGPAQNAWSSAGPTTSGSKHTDSAWWTLTPDLGHPTTIGTLVGPQNSSHREKSSPSL
eukprot:618826-Rhodomonas_salina.1